MVARGLLLVAALGGFLAVALGAFGAHALKEVMSTYLLQIYQTAVSYQFYHSVTLLFVVLFRQQYNGRLLMIAGYCLAAGMIIFCLSLYLLAWSGIGWLGAITPMGGGLLLIGWLLLAGAAFNVVQRK